MKKHTLVLGASPKEERYSNRATKKLVAAGHSVVAVGLRNAMIDATPIVKEIPEDEVFDTVALYVGTDNQVVWEDKIIALAPRRLIFNPGTENERLAERATKNGIEVVEGCTLVMLAAGTY